LNNANDRFINILLLLLIDNWSVTFEAAVNRNYYETNELLLLAVMMQKTVGEWSPYEAVFRCQCGTISFSLFLH
jgi:hypothetical protein